MERITIKTVVLLGLVYFMCVANQVHAAPITFNMAASWTDKDGNTHSARDVRVEFWDNDDFTADDLLGTKQTSNAGFASITVENSDEFGTLDPFLRVYARSDVAFVSSDGTLANTYKIETPTTNNVTGGIHNMLATAGKDNNAGKAFSIHQAIEFHHDYATTKLGAITPAGGITVTFPAAGGTSANATTINVHADDWQDWDVLQHEYGHVLALNNNLQGGILGDSHKFGVDNIGKPGNDLGNDKGTRLAWQEGLATYLSLSAQDAGNLRTVIPGLPAELGDEFYDDTVDVPLHVSIENRGANVGEGDEASVMRILWDLYDTDTENYFHDDEYSDKWALGDKEVFDLMKGNATLRDFWSDVVDKHAPSFKLRAELGEVLEEYGVSNILTNPMDNAVVNIGKITFVFTEQNSTLSNLFKILVFDELFTTIVDQSPTLNDIFSWTSAIDFSPGKYNWVALNNSVLDTSIDLKKSYWSGSYQFSVVPEPGVLLLFTTGLVLISLVRSRRRAISWAGESHEDKCGIAH